MNIINLLSSVCNHVACFKHWENKRFSIFKSLGKVVKIGALMLTYFLLGCFNGFSQIDTVKVKEIEINSNRVPTTYSETSRIVTIISKEAIANLPVNTLEEILETALNVDVRQRSSAGVQADVSIRGGSFEQTLILLNGVKVNDPQTGHHNLNIPVSIDNIERIEILEGSGARIYGPNAFSGAINIITNDNNSRSQLRFAGEAGEHNLYKGNLSINVKQNNVNTYISASKNVCDGYIADTDYDFSSFFAQMRFAPKFGKIDLQGGHLNKAFGASNFYVASKPNEFEHTRTNFASMKFSTGTNVHYSQTVYYRRNRDKFELYRDNPILYQNFHLTDVYGTDINSYFTSILGRTAIGGEYRVEKILSNRLGDLLAEPQPISGEDGFNYTYGKKRESVNLFVDHTVAIRSLSISLGLLANSNSGYGWNIFPGIDVSYNLNKSYKLFASVNQTLRIPTFTELFYSDPTKTPNPDLKPEKALTYEAGIKFNNSIIESHFAVFRREGSDQIDWVRLNATDKWKSENIIEVIANGAEYSVKMNPQKMLGKKFFIDNFQMSFSYLSNEKQSGNYYSTYVLDYLKYKLNLNIHHRILRTGIYASWQFSYQKREGAYTLVNGTEESYKGFGLLDARISYREKRWEVFADVSNVFNTKYFDYGNIEMPRRWIKGGIKFNLYL